MKICVFDTETTSINKPFSYNIGYVIADTETREVLLEKDFVVEQIWHNPMLFCTAYYADKKPLYISSMRARKTQMKKFGHITQEMIRDFRFYGVEWAFAYNSKFDVKVFDFNCDWFKCINPFDSIPVSDIRGFVHRFLVDKKFESFCDEHEYFTETGNYSTTAETVYRYISNNTDFIEDHTALSDSKIECDILFSCLDYGAEITGDYKAFFSIRKTTKKTLHIKTTEQVDFYFDYTKMKINKDKTEIILK